MSRAARRWMPVLVLVLAAAGTIPGGAEASQSQAGARSSVDAGLRSGDVLHQQFRPIEALAELQEILASNPDEYGALWRAARETVSLGMLSQEPDDATRWYLQAEGFARRAVEVHPRGVEGNEWMAIALGRRALEAGPRARVSMAEEIRDAALTILAIDPDNSGGLHVLGEWNAEVMRLRGVTRFMARQFLGGESFDQASWEQAQTLLERAVAITPERLIHHFDLARVYMDRGDRERARSSLRQVMDRPALDPVDPLLKQRAVALLQSL